jgi:hypothetical protein
MRKQLESIEDLVEQLCSAAQDVSEPVSSKFPALQTVQKLILQVIHQRRWRETLIHLSLARMLLPGFEGCLVVPFVIWLLTPDNDYSRIWQTEMPI